MVAEVNCSASFRMKKARTGMSTITQAPASHFSSAAAACWTYPMISPM